MSTEQTAVATTGWPLISSLVLGALPTAADCARLHARNVTTEWGLSNIAETVELVVSELVTNAVQASQELNGSWFDGKHAPGMPPVRLWLESGEASVVIHVWDGNEEIPERREPGNTEENGRGLLLVETLSEEHGVDRLKGATGKVVWARVEH